MENIKADKALIAVCGLYCGACRKYLMADNEEITIETEQLVPSSGAMTKPKCCSDITIQATRRPPRRTFLYNDQNDYHAIYINRERQADR